MWQLDCSTKKISNRDTPWCIKLSRNPAHNANLNTTINTVIRSINITWLVISPDRKGTTRHPPLGCPSVVTSAVCFSYLPLWINWYGFYERESGEKNTAWWQLSKLAKKIAFSPLHQYILINCSGQSTRVGRCGERREWLWHIRLCSAGGLPPRMYKTEELPPTL